LATTALTGLASLKVVGDHAHITDFLLSCRVFGKKVEDAIFAILVSEARAMGATLLTATFRPTAKNDPCLQFLERGGFRHVADGSMFSWNTDDEFEAPGHIRLVGCHCCGGINRSVRSLEDRATPACN
jgi:predicted enzyme involved in methoxymalonyl-ACP biosynthesis